MGAEDSEPIITSKLSGQRLSCARDEIAVKAWDRKNHKKIHFSTTSSV
jgi:hypothetical protein